MLSYVLPFLQVAPEFVVLWAPLAVVQLRSSTSGKSGFLSSLAFPAGET